LFCPVKNAIMSGSEKNKAGYAIEKKQKCCEI
jgi:hypothetical protein